MRLKPGVNADDVAPAVWVWLGVIAVHHRASTNDSLMVTSLKRKSSPRPSLHVPQTDGLVYAADLRRWYLDDDGTARSFVTMLRERHSNAFVVLLEPEDLSPEQIAERGGLDEIDPHIHLQLRNWGIPAAL